MRLRHSLSSCSRIYSILASIFLTVQGPPLELRLSLSSRKDVGLSRRGLWSVPMSLCRALKESQANLIINATYFTNVEEV